MEMDLEKIMSIRQEGTVNKYCEEFRFLFDQVKNSEEMSEDYATYLFIFGLKPEIGDILMGYHNAGQGLKLEDAFLMARLRERALSLDSNQEESSNLEFEYAPNMFDERPKRVGNEIQESSNGGGDSKEQKGGQKDDQDYIDLGDDTLEKDIANWVSVHGSTINTQETEIQVETKDENGQEPSIMAGILLKSEESSKRLGSYSSQFTNTEIAPKVFGEIPKDIMNATRSDFKESVNENDNDVIVSENEIKTIAINEKIVILAEDSKKNTIDVETNKDKKLECLDVLDELVSLVDSGDIKRIDQEIIEKESVHVILPSVIGMVQEKVNDVGTVLIKDRKEWQFSINLIVVESFEWKPGGLGKGLKENRKDNGGLFNDTLDNDLHESKTLNRNKSSETEMADLEIKKKKIVSLFLPDVTVTSKQKTKLKSKTVWMRVLSSLWLDHLVKTSEHLGVMGLRKKVGSWKRWKRLTWIDTGLPIMIKTGAGGRIYYDVLEPCLQLVLTMNVDCLNRKIFMWLRWKYKVLLVRFAQMLLSGQKEGKSTADEEDSWSQVIEAFHLPILYGGCVLLDEFMAGAKVVFFCQQWKHPLPF